MFMDVFGKFFRRTKEPPPLTDEEVKLIAAKLTPQIATWENVDVLSPYSIEQREYLATQIGKMVLYFGDEVIRVKRAEENAALSAAPKGYDISELQGLNIGCGDRTISPYLLPVDMMRKSAFGASSGEHATLHDAAFLALSDNLPFKEGSIDYIVALHFLEHVEEPVEILKYWLTLLKPGGGIGIVVPHWKYTWDARKDAAPFGHKWNPTPELVVKLHDEHLSDLCRLETLDTYEYKISFDFVLRKPGVFVPFKPPSLEGLRSGKQRHDEGIFLHGG
jgi:SAM-dependent methyltransferase